MRRTLFESHSDPEFQKPRLRPNIFARLAQFSVSHAVPVLLFWIFLCAGFLTLAVLKQKNVSQQPLTFAATSQAQENLNLLSTNFPNLESLIALNITNVDSEKLKSDRDGLLAKLNEGENNFELVFSPGSGTYYDRHFILYHSLEDVKARVAYAQSLRPLFSAIAEAPTTESLTTLVNEVSASIELGRDPQGLDELFSEAALAVQALMLGNERQVDWRRVAGLNFEPKPTSALIFVLPKPATAAEATAKINNIIEALPKADGTTTIVDQTAPPTSTTTAANSGQLVPGLIMMGIFVIFSIMILIGQFNLAAMIVAPVVCVEAILVALTLFFMPERFNAIWPLAIGLACATTQLSTRYAFAMLSVLQISRSRESAAMLVAQKQGGGLLFLTFGFIMLWSTSALVLQRDFEVIAIVSALTLATACLAVLTVTPAILRALPGVPEWRAEEWIAPLYQALFNNRGWRLLRQVLAPACVAFAIYGFWNVPHLQGTTPPDQNQASVNLVAHSVIEAEAILLKLKSVRQAQAARWLGAFLPQDVDEKLAVLHKLKSSFQSITPLIPTTTDILREQIGTLGESLQAIASSPATRPELRKSAQEFRQSMELLTSTSSDKEVRAFDNRIFGSFNVLSEEADALAGLEKPNFSTLDPKLRALFLSNSDIYRLEVTPIQKVSNSELATVLSGQNFPVAHPALVFSETTTMQKRIYLTVIAAVGTLAILALALATRELAGLVATMFVSSIGSGVVTAIFYLLNCQVGTENVLLLITFSTFMLGLLVTAFLKPEIQRAVVQDELHAVEAWLPAVLLLAISAPCLLLNLQPIVTQLVCLTSGVAALTIVTAFLLRPITIFLRSGSVS
jgi:uncharacterized protein